jgi:polyhydroxybutyrate depolymerase
MKELAAAFLGLSGVVLGACSDAGVPDPSAAGGSSGSAGTASTSGGMTAGGSAGSSAASGTAGQNGGSGSGGAGSGGGAGGTAGGTSGSGGAGGSGGVTTSGGGGAGGGGGKVAPNPSMGCNKQNPQTGSAGSPLTVSGHQYYVKLPTGYDPTKAYPTMIMFNPTNNPIDWAEKSAGFEAAGPKESWIRVYPHPANTSAGWGAGDVAFFEPLYEQITGNYCIDKARVFAAGESSGGDFSSILGCEHGDKLRAIGPCATKNVQQYPLDADERQCKGDVTAVIIHGKNDSVVGTENGPKTRDFYAAVNHCMSMTMPVTGYTDKLSNCVMFQGCDPGTPVYWCQHEDPNYSNTNHGWPAFAPKFLYGLFSQL